MGNRPADQFCLSDFKTKKTMKSTFLKISVFILLLAFMGAGCEKDGTAKAPDPGLTIYKTRNDYFDKMNINLLNGKVYYLPDVLIVTDNNGEVHLKSRVKLVDGYTLASGDHSILTAFLGYTIEEFYNMTEVQKIHPSFDDLQDSIIDTEPFVEYYYDSNSPAIFGLGDTALINEIIRKGEIEKYFKKLK